MGVKVNCASSLGAMKFRMKTLLDEGTPNLTACKDFMESPECVGFVQLLSTALPREAQKLWAKGMHCCEKQEVLKAETEQSKRAGEKNKPANLPEQRNVSQAKVPAPVLVAGKMVVSGVMKSSAAGEKATKNTSESLRDRMTRSPVRIWLCRRRTMLTDLVSNSSLCIPRVPFCTRH